MKLVFRSLWTVLSVACVATAAAQTPIRLQPSQSEVVFVTKQMGVPVEGRFKTFDATLDLDPKKPEAGSVSIRINMQSGSLGVAEADAEMPKSTWFDVAKFPEASFTSTAIKGQGNGKFMVSGKLTIKGIARDVTVPVAITQSGSTSTATGTFVVKRVEHKIGEGEWADPTVVANDVQVRFKLAFTGLGPL
ncbi:MAG TPA: YceI family protein [Burkholderiaceae bacterium]|nr:YceI family protein [Burkholderiaceae bacterium]